MKIKKNEINYTFFKRNEEKSNKIIRHGVETIDFIIDSKPLLNILVNKSNGGHNDYMGCFSKGWDKLNNDSKNKLLLKKEPDTTDGRTAIYVCPECADIGCGAYCCKIEKTNELYIWKDFAYENGYEDAIIIDKIGPYYFDKKDYEELILKISKI
jgi:hypothetical protein